MVADHVHFQMLDPAVYKDVHDMIICGPEDNNGDGESKYCLASSGQSVFPKFNLVDPTLNNETMYALRLADELVRVRRIQESFLHAASAATTTTEYSIADDEVVIPWKDVHKTRLTSGPTVWDTATPDFTTTSPLEMMD